MNRNKDDRRIRRTRSLLQEAMVTLILEKPYHKITVQDIIDRADVGRSTFYAHFPDKEALLASTFDDLASDLDHRIQRNSDTQHLLHVHSYFFHAQENRDFYQAMIEGGGIDLVLDTGQRHIEQSIRVHLKKMEVDTESLRVPLPVLINFLTGSLLSMLTWWIEEEMPYTPEQMAKTYEQLVMPGFLGLLA